MELSTQSIIALNGKEIRKIGWRILLGILIVNSFSCNPSGKGKTVELSRLAELAEISDFAGIDISKSQIAPLDIAGGAQNAQLKDVAVYAWALFIAMNWPAKSGVRDMHDGNAVFGDPAYSGLNGLPLVWHTFRSKIEIYPNSEPNGYVNDSTQSYGYDSPPKYLYTPGTVTPGVGQVPVTTQPPWINLDEISQISLNKMYAGVLPAVLPGNNTAPNLIRFTPKANRQEYVYIAENQWYGNKNNAYYTALSNFTTAIKSKPPVIPQSPTVQFPNGTIEIKAAWRPLGSKDDPSRFYTAKVRYYEEIDESNIKYYDEVWALIALHIIVKTETTPYFVYTTFEQADNLLTSDGKPVEDENGKIINYPASSGPTTPGLLYQDSPTQPTLNVTGGYCSDTQNILYYHNESTQNGLPSGGDICVDRRYHDIPDTVIAVNKSVHAGIKQYNSKNGLTTSPWLYYKLVNVQWQPFDKSVINPSDPNGNYNPATFYQANIVVETNYTLQKFSGRQIRFTPSKSIGLPTDYPKGSSSPDFHNVYEFNNKIVTSSNMGGCMGCHGNAQVAGNDFSFILQNSPFLTPEGPSIASVSLFKRYKY